MSNNTDTMVGKTIIAPQLKCPACGGTVLTIYAEGLHSNIFECWNCGCTLEVSIRYVPPGPQGD